MAGNTRRPEGGDTEPIVTVAGDGRGGLAQVDTDPEVPRWSGETRRALDGGRFSTSPLQIVAAEGIGELIATPPPALASISAITQAMPEAMAVLERYASSEAGLTDSVQNVQALIIGLLEIVNRQAERNTQLRASLKKLLEELKISHIEKYTDALTGLPNQRALFEFVAKLFEVYREPRIPFSVVLIDLDLFHDLNTKYGYEGGDFVLAEVSRVIQEAVNRSGDACFYPTENGLAHLIPTRAGGEEFMIVLPETDLAGASVVAKRIWQAILDHNFTFKGQRVQVTASIGVTEVDYEKHSNLDDVRNPANEALKVCKDKSYEDSGAIRSRNGVYQHDGNVITRVAQGVPREKSSRDSNPTLGVRLDNVLYYLKGLSANVMRRLVDKGNKPKRIDKAA